MLPEQATLCRRIRQHYLIGQSAGTNDVKLLRTAKTFSYVNINF